MATRLRADELAQLAALLEAAVPFCGANVDYIERRVATGAIGPAEVRAVLHTKPSAENLAGWSQAPNGSHERNLFDAVRSCAWEASLCDPAWGGNIDGRGWERFGIDGPMKTRSRP